KVLQACLVAWAATEKPEHARTAIRFFTALLDDLDKIGDGLGGDESARRDHGYAIRNLGPYTALAYDWLHDQPAITPNLAPRPRAPAVGRVARLVPRERLPRAPPGLELPGRLPRRGDADRDRAGRRGGRGGRTAVAARRRRAVGQGHGRRARDPRHPRWRRLAG